jgi:hypothetical protein
MKLIELSQGRVAIVDDEDFDWVSKWKWSYWRCKEKRTGYARRLIGQRTNHRRVISMHTAIVQHGGQKIQNRQLDHCNGCGCDNRKLNLRLATQGQNLQNKKRYKNNTSKITGVNWCGRQNKWRAYISRPDTKRPKHLGWFRNKKDAVEARQQAEIEFFKDFRHNPKNLCSLWKTGRCPDCARRASIYGLN